MGPNQLWLVSLQKEETWHAVDSTHEDTEKMAINQPRREASGVTNPTDTLIWLTDSKAMRKRISVV